MDIKNVGQDDHWTPAHFMHKTGYTYSQHPMRKLVIIKTSKNYHLPKEKSRRDPEYWQILELSWMKLKICQVYFSASRSGW